MKSRHGIAAAAIVLMTMGVSAASAAPFTNGSFEDAANFVDTEGSGNSMLLPSGSNALTAWTVVGGGTVLWAGPGSDGYTGLTSSDGAYWLDLTGLTNQCPPNGVVCAGVSQDITTIVGDNYRLTFDFAGRGDSVPVSILASAGASSQLFTTSAVNTTSSSWATATLDFTATGTLTSLTLQGVSAGASGLDLSLDNVTLSAIPEPLTLSLFGAGFACIATLRRRKKKIA